MPSRAEVTEIEFTAFSAQKKTDQVPGRLIVRRIPDFNAAKKAAAGQGTLFDVWRFHAFFTTADPGVLDTVAADKTQRGHAIIEQVHADLKGSALAHLPSGMFAANAAWLVLTVMAFNLTRATGVLAGPQLAKATTGTMRPQAHQRPGQGRDLGPSDHPAPAHRLALADRLDRLVRPSQRPTSTARVLTNQSQERREASTRGTPRTARSGSFARPHTTQPTPPRSPPDQRVNRWIEA